MNKPISSWEDFDKRIEIAKELVGFDKRQYLLNTIKMAHDFHPEKFNDRLADLIISSNDPRIMTYFNELVDKGIASGNTDGTIIYAPYVYQQKQPEKIFSLFEKLADTEPDFTIGEKSFWGFDLTKFVNGINFKESSRIKVKDYAKALKETPSDYAKMLQGKK